MKKIVYPVIVLALALMLAPNFWLGLFNKEEESPPPNTTNIAEQGNRSVAANPFEQEYTLYAEGYGPHSFGEAFNPPMPDAAIQPEGIWKVLLKLRFDLRYDHATEEVIHTPLFTPEIEQYDKKEIEVEGYIVPHDLARLDAKSSSMFMFSAVPPASCFFCGQAGPESIIETYPAKPIPFSKDPIKLKGRLELNRSDPMRMAYILRDARMVQ